MKFDFRALEVSSMRMWQRDAIIEALNFIVQHEMNALVLHETDGLQKILYPQTYFDPYAKWQSAPTRRGENAILNNRIYFEHVLNLAERRGVAVWLEIKQLGFPDEVLELRPDLVKDGVVCPSEPFWFEFLETSVTELYRDFPKLAGLIVSAGSPEGRASRAQNKCGCDICRATTIEDWDHDLIMSMWRPTEAAGKGMAVRDFAYKPRDHAPVIAAMKRAPKDVVFCIKATPHDFYPTFPDNAAIGVLRDRVQWLEYDTMGQFYGLALAPCYVGDDMHERLRRGEGKGVSGAIFRVDWERINDWWSLETLNVVNLIAAAMMTRGEPTSTERVVRLWLKSEGYAEDCASWLASLLDETWPIVSRALYIDGFMFADSSFFPRSVGRAWWTMETKHSLIDWDPSRSEDLKLDTKRVAELIAEKADARTRVKAYRERVESGDPTLPPELHRALIEQAKLFETYIEGFEKCARVCLWCRARQEGVPQSSESLDAAIVELEGYRDRIRPITDEALLPHQVAQLIDFHRVDDILREGREILDQRVEEMT